ncbi:MAG: PepSY-like domain-containing protein [Armatimonadetes bacterium]|nr:PepSY-like domain-containing protein [Akkermansiaceae bacterium]
MKTTSKTIIALAALIAVSASAEKVAFNQLPTLAQNTINQRKGPDAIKDIELKTRNGVTAYEVEFDRLGFNPKLVVAADGSVIEDHRTRGEMATDNRTLKWDLPNWHRTTLTTNDLPPRVQQTIRNESRGRKVVDIDREKWHGQPVIEVEFQQKGRNAHIYVADNGAIVKDERVGTAPSILFMGTQLEDLPTAAQSKIKEQAGTGKIKDIDKEIRDGRVVYEIEIEPEAGDDFHLVIAPDGVIFKDTRSAVGAPASQLQRGAGSKFTFDQVPLEVQTAINAHGGAAAVIDIEKASSDGKSNFKVRMKPDGAVITLQIAEDGTVVVQ